VRKGHVRSPRPRKSDAVLAAVKGKSAARWPSATLDGHCAQRPYENRSGRGDVARQSNKKMLAYNSLDTNRRIQVQGCRSVFRARNGMTTMARTPVLPEATPVGALSAQSGRFLARTTIDSLRRKAGVRAARLLRPPVRVRDDRQYGAATFDVSVAKALRRRVSAPFPPPAP
jgi:hypothetical protein